MVKKRLGGNSANREIESCLCQYVAGRSFMDESSMRRCGVVQKANLRHAGLVAAPALHGDVSAVAEMHGWAVPVPERHLRRTD